MTETILVVVVAGLLAWEVYTLKSSTDRHRTITEVVRKVVGRNPLVAFLAGLLCGHLFWP